MQEESPSTLEIEVHSGVREISAESWDALVGEGSPFLAHGFLALLEETGCVSESSGWIPAIFTATLVEGEQESRRLVGALPFYLKMHSAGEFVFDWSWADAANRAGLSYYPKAVVAVPFTPVTGERILVDPELPSRAGVRHALVHAALEFARSHDLSSVHFNFLREPDATFLSEEVGLPLRYGIQYHWYNGPEQGQAEAYQDWDEFLARFRSKRRANIRRERRKLDEAGVTTQVHLGEAIDEALMARVYEYYRDTVQKFYWGRQYLSREFFLRLPEVVRDRIHVVEASHQGEPFAGTFNMLKNGRLYGRYWGALREIDFTHFEVCMYRPIEWCIEHGVRVFEPGAGGEHKYERGFEPTRMVSAHELVHPSLDEAIRDFLRHERGVIEQRIAAMEEDSCLK